MYSSGKQGRFLILLPSPRYGQILVTCWASVAPARRFCERANRVARAWTSLVSRKQPILHPLAVSNGCFNAFISLVTLTVYAATWLAAVSICARMSIRREMFDRLLPGTLANRDEHPGRHLRCKIAPVQADVRLGRGSGLLSVIAVLSFMHTVRISTVKVA